LNKIIKKLSLLATLTLNLALAACGGATGYSAGGGSGTAADKVSINGTTYTANGSIVKISGYINQIHPYAYQLGGPMGAITMSDTQSGNRVSFQVLSTIDGWPGVYGLMSTSTGTYAMITDKSVTTGGVMLDLADGSGTGGSISINSFGDIGQPITGSFDMNLCDINATFCLAAVKKYSGTFSVIRTANFGSLTKPVTFFTSTPAAPVSYSNGITPATGKNYYIVNTNVTGGTLTITLTPATSGDVNLAVYTDAGYTTPATCDVSSTLNVIGSAAETCGITVIANQKLYLTVRQTTAAVALETYALKMTE